MMTSVMMVHSFILLIQLFFRDMPNRKQKRNGINSMATETVANTMSEWPILPDTVCAVCMGGSDEQEVLICDGACGNEIHMYCLRPQLSIVPTDDWLCPSCAYAGNTSALGFYFSFHETSKITANLDSTIRYEKWLLFQQWNSNLYPWRSNKFMDLTESIISDEFDSYKYSIIGMEKIRRSYFSY